MQSHLTPTPLLGQPTAPVPDDMLGASIAHYHPNRVQFPGEHISTVKQIREYVGRSAPKGTYLLVSTPDMNIPYWVHESDFLRYERPASQTVYFVPANVSAPSLATVYPGRSA